jgi:hypothetical protein
MLPAQDSLFLPRRKGANIGLGLFQRLFHLFDPDFIGIENRGVDLTAVLPPLAYFNHTFSPIQGVLADVVSADDKSRLLQR